MTNQQQQRMIDPADVQKVIDRHSGADETTDCRNVLDDVLRDLRGLLPKPDYPEDMFGMWAEHPEHGRVLVCSAKPDKCGEVEIAARDNNEFTGTTHMWVAVSTLSFPERHPDTLTTLEDYKNAPVGTVVALDRHNAWTKRQDTWRSPGVISDNADMKGEPMRVLRWGWIQ